MLEEVLKDLLRSRLNGSGHRRDLIQKFIVVSADGVDATRCCLMSLVWISMFAFVVHAHVCMCLCELLHVNLCDCLLRICL